MLSYLLKRILWLIPTVFFVITVVFFLAHLLPGDPVDFILGEQALPSERQKLVEQLHLDKPILTQYGLFLKELAQGSLGDSFFKNKSVMSLIKERYGATIQLTLFSMLIAISLAIPLGLISAAKKDRALDYSASFFSLLGISIPNFYLGPLLILLFAIKLQWLPVSSENGLSSLILPAITLGTALAAMTSRMTRASMIDIMKMDYIRTARAKGLKNWKVFLKHGFRSALIPVITVIGLQFGSLLAGTVVTEKIFNWPGIGLLLLQSIQGRDYPIVQGCVLIIALTFILVNLLTDILYAWIDPRVKL